MSDKLYLQTIEERIKIVQGLIDYYGDYYEIVLHKIKQYDDRSMYVGKMRVDSTFALIKRLPRNYECMTGIQRALKKDKVDDIEEAIRTNATEYSLPNSVVITLNSLPDTGIIEMEILDESREIIIYKINLRLLLSILLNDTINEMFCGILCDGRAKR